jgi:hypothetical protein
MILPQGVSTRVGIGAGVLLALGGAGLVLVRHWLKAQFPVLDVDDAEVGKWYSVHPDGAIDAAGKPYHANLRVGSENKVMVVLGGGGVSVDSYTEARPVTGIFDKGFYTNIDGLDQLAKGGFARDTEGNPFRTWTVVHLPYSTGDFHAGAGVNEVVGLDGQSQSVHHAGFTNLELVLEAVKEITGTPTELMVTGSSAGGFGAAIVTGRVMDFFPDTTNVTTMVDSSLLLYDWNSVSRNVWKSPTEVAEVLTTNNCTLDALTALKADRPSVKILFASSIRDDTLSRMQSYLSGGEFEVSAQDGVQYQADLRMMVNQLRDQVPGVGLYIFQGKTKKRTGLTQHTIGRRTQDRLVGGTTPLEWVSRAVAGDVKSFGVELVN